MRVVIDGGRAGPETAEVHGPVDLAAALAEEAWSTSTSAIVIGRLIDQLRIVLEAVVSDSAASMKLDEMLGCLSVAITDSCRSSARLGYALARTAESMNQGWPTWLAAAEAQLLAAGCTPSAHPACETEDSDDFAAAWDKHHLGSPVRKNEP